jgi:hypothetical protein
MAMRVTGWQMPRIRLFFPGLLGPWPAPLIPQICQGLSLPHTADLLASAKRVSTSSGERVAEFQLLEYLLGELGDGGGARSVGLARLSAARDAIDGESILRADPVYIEAGINGARLATGTEIHVTQADARRFIALLNEYFVDHGVTLSVGSDPARWYAQFDRLPSATTRAIFELPYSDVPASMPAGEEGARLRSLMNEAQMILHECALNRGRAERGLEPINSLWFWGEGRTLQATCSSIPTLWVDDPIGECIAWHDRGEIPAHPDALLASLLDGARIEGDHLVAWLHPARAVADGHVERWRDLLESFEKRWAGAILRSRSSIRFELLCPGSSGARFVFSESGWRRLARGLLGGMRGVATPDRFVLIDEGSDC